MVIFEAPAPLTQSGFEIWIAAAGGVNWGGCEVWASSDNTTFRLLGRINGRARHGVLTAALPTGTAVPGTDSVNTLSVDLTASLGALGNATAGDLANLLSLCYVGGEFLAYETATLTAAYKYDLTILKRGAYGSPIASSAAIGTKFARCDDSLFKFPFPSSMVGQTIYFKFPAFNTQGGALQALASISSVSHVIGTPVGMPAGGPIGTGWVHVTAGAYDTPRDLIAADVVSGVFGISHLATGTPSGSKFIRDDGVLAVPPGTGTGEANTSSNAGSGTGLAKAKSGVDLPFKSLLAGTGISLSSATNEVTISATGGAAVTDPTTLSGCQLWLRGSSLTSLGNGTAVGTWSDESGTSNDMVQSTAGRKGTVKTGQINGLTALGLDDSDDGYLSTYNFSAAYTLFVVYAPNWFGGGGGGSRRVIQGNVANWLVGPRDNFHRFYNGIFHGGPATRDGIYRAICVTGDTHGGAMFCEHDTVWVDTDFKSGGTAVPGVLTLGAIGAVGEAAASDVAFVYGFNRILTRNEREGIFLGFDSLCGGLLGG